MYQVCTPHPDTLTCATCHPNQPLVAGGRGRVRRVPALHGRVRAAGAEGGRRDGAEPEVRPASAAASLPLSLRYKIYLILSYLSLSLGRATGSTPHPLFGVATPLFACGHTEECVRSIFRWHCDPPPPPFPRLRHQHFARAPPTSANVAGAGEPQGFGESTTLVPIITALSDPPRCPVTAACTGGSQPRKMPSEESSVKAAAGAEAAAAAGRGEPSR